MAVLRARILDTLDGRTLTWIPDGVLEVVDGRIAAVGPYDGRPVDEDLRPVLLDPWTRTVDLLPGEWLILATDGLSDYAAEEEAGIGRLLRQAVERVRDLPAREATMKVARELVNAANEGGGGDNVTVLALTLDGIGALAADEETVG